MLCNVCENAAVVQPLFTSFLGGISINEPSNQSNDSLYHAVLAPRNLTFIIAAWDSLQKGCTRTILSNLLSNFA